MFRGLLALLLAVSPAFGAGEILTISSLEEADAFLKSKRLKIPVVIAVDIHGTLAEARRYERIGSVPWVRDMTSRRVPFCDICGAWAEIQLRVDLSLLERNADDIIFSWQTQHHVIAVTGGLVGLSHRYDQQLHAIGLSFISGHPPFNIDRIIRASDKREPSKQMDIAYRDGILAVGPFVSKGTGIQRLLETVDVIPGTVILIDNERRFLDEGSATFKDFTDFFGLHLDSSQQESLYSSDRAIYGLRRFTERFTEAVPTCGRLLHSLRETP